MTGAKMRRPSKGVRPAVGFGMLGGCEAVTEAADPGLNSPTATAGLNAPATINADKLYAPELTACSHSRPEVATHIQPLSNAVCNFWALLVQREVLYVCSLAGRLTRKIHCCSLKRWPLLR